MAPKSPRQAEFGDFQTPAALAAGVCAQVERLLGVPRTVIEPTCGVGNFLVAAHERFGARTSLIGLELDPGYLEHARAALASVGRTDARLIHGDVFATDWTQLIADADGPVLVLGNPPWVTNSALGALASDNVPEKSNAQKLRGLDAITGKSNFDISEWMGIRIMRALAPRDGGFALLIKTAVARKLLTQAWTEQLQFRDLAIFAIDAKQHFDAAVDACLFVGRAGVGERRCPVHADLDGERQTGLIGIDEAGALIPDLRAWRETASLAADADDEPQWRSGIKHDCARVFELREIAGELVNGFGEVVELEHECLFPLRKSSDIANGRASARRLIVTQRMTGEDTERLRTAAPRTWNYLLTHAELLDARKSSIYRGRPRFSIFGVGEYSFTGWKVAISGLYKRLEFRLVGPEDGRPVVFDDTVYFVACADERSARRTLELLESEPARRFLDAQIFWDAKRPVTAAVLRRLSLAKLAARRPGA